MRILLIEDDTVLGAAVRDQVRVDGHSVDWVTRLDSARDALAVTAYDLVLLDLMLPDGRGVPFLRALRANGDTTPVIILTALDQVSDRIDGLNAGADDYMVKPFDLAELSARIGSVARRYTGNPNPIIRLGPLDIDLAARTIRKNGKVVALTARDGRCSRPSSSGRASFSPRDSSKSGFILSAPKSKVTRSRCM
jgi:two-component system, OmpR family, response regulator